MTLSNNASTGFIKSLGANARGIIVTQVYPNERAVTYPMVKKPRTWRAQGLGDISPPCWKVSPLARCWWKDSNAQG